jgi:large subunit ribosomal protein L25
MLDVSQTSLTVEAEATHIPTEFEISVQGFQIGDAVHARDIKLPDGVTLAGDPDATIVHVVAKQTAEQFEAETAAPEGSAPSPVVEAPADDAAAAE